MFEEVLLEAFEVTKQRAIQYWNTEEWTKGKHKHMTGGANSIRIERPAGVPVRMKLHGGAASIEFDHQKHGPLVDFDAGVIAATIGVTSAGLGGKGGITMESPGASTAGDRYELEFTGGANKIAVVELG